MVQNLNKIIILAHEGQSPRVVRFKCKADVHLHAGPSVIFLIELKILECVMGRLSVSFYTVEKEHPNVPTPKEALEL